MNIKIVASLLIVLLTIQACKDGNKPENNLEVVEVKTKKDNFYHSAEEVNVDFNNEKITEIFNNYIEVKTALINTNADETAEAASRLMVALNKFESNKNILEATQSMADTREIEVQRSAFVIVTDEVEKIIDGEISNGTVYKQFCPMAFDNSGASWLSASKEIANPYFGNKMYRCGRVQATLE